MTLQIEVWRGFPHGGVTPAYPITFYELKTGDFFTPAYTSRLEIMEARL